jgi:hypothetical protein
MNTSLAEPRIPTLVYARPAALPSSPQMEHTDDISLHARVRTSRAAKVVLCAPEDSQGPSSRDNSDSVISGSSRRFLSPRPLNAKLHVQDCPNFVVTDAESVRARQNVGEAVDQEAYSMGMCLIKNVFGSLPFATCLMLRTVPCNLTYRLKIRMNKYILQA